ACWLVEAEFVAPKGPNIVQVAVVGPGDRYAVRVSNNDTASRELQRKRGWHRLTIEFTADSLHILVDDRVLWEVAERGPGGPLRVLRLRCLTDRAEKGEAGRVWFDDCSVLLAVPSLRRPDSDPTQDEVWLLDGDQLLGKVSRADRRTIDVQGRFG